MYFSNISSPFFIQNESKSEISPKEALFLPVELTSQRPSRNDVTHSPGSDCNTYDKVDIVHCGLQVERGFEVDSRGKGGLIFGRSLSFGAIMRKIGSENINVDFSLVFPCHSVDNKLRLQNQQLVLQTKHCAILCFPS